jgi:hypothetical protein
MLMFTLPEHRRMCADLKPGWPGIIGNKKLGFKGTRRFF